MKGTFTDLRCGFRMLTRRPLMSLVIITTFALGIGANGALVSLLYAIFLKPLAFGDPNQLVQLAHVYPEFNLQRAPISPRLYREYEERNRVFESLSASVSWQGHLSDDGETTSIQGALVSGNFFRTLKISAEIGRTFVDEEDVPGNHRVVVISHKLWRERFARSRSIIGEPIRINGESMEILGVMPRGFKMTRQSDFWIPLAFTPEQRPSLMPEMEPHVEYLEVIGRLKPGINFTGAQSALAALGDELRSKFFSEDSRWRINAIPLHEALITMRAEFRPSIMLVAISTAVVLMVIFANIAGFQLARSIERSGEWAMRIALGSGYTRIVRQSLIESAMLATVGGIFGLLVASWIRQLAVYRIPREWTESLPGWQQLAPLDSVTVMAIIGYTVVISCLLGLLPLLRIGRHQLAKQIGCCRTKSSDQLSTCWHRWMVVSQVALTLVLMSTTALLLRSFLSAIKSDPGFDSASVLTAQLNLPKSRYDSKAKVRAFYQAVEDRLMALPGVTAGGLATVIPLIGSAPTTLFSVLHRPHVAESRPHGMLNPVSPGYLKAMGIPILQGRPFHRADDNTTTPVAIVDEKMAQLLWPHESPIGKQVMVSGFEDGVQRTVIGVVRHIKQTGLDRPSKFLCYVPHSQLSLPTSSMYMAMRVTENPAVISRDLRRIISDIDPYQSIAQVHTMDDIANRSLGTRRLVLVLVLTFAGITLGLALLGIVGMIYHTVTQRTRELGIRMAIGATRTSLLTKVIFQGVQWVIIGILVGLAGALAAARSLAVHLFGIRAIDPQTLATVSAAILVSAIIACCPPALRILRINPSNALRHY